MRYREPRKNCLRKLSIRTKILVLLSVTAFVAVAVTSVLMRQHVGNDLISRLQLRSQLFARATALSSESVGSSPDLQRIIQALAAEPEVESLFVVDCLRNRIMASNRSEWVGRDLDDSLPDDLLIAIQQTVQTQQENFLVDQATGDVSAIVPCGLRLRGNQVSKGAVIARLAPERMAAVSASWESRAVRTQMGTIALLIVVVSLALEVLVARPAKRLQREALQRWTSTHHELDSDDDEIQELDEVLSLAEGRIDQVLEDLEQLKKAVDASAVVLVCDELGNLVDINARFTQLSAWKPEGLIGQPPPLVEPSLLDEISESIAAGVSWRGELRVIKASAVTADDENELHATLVPSASILWLDVTVVPVSGADSTPQAMWIGIDVTSRREAEANAARVQQSTAAIVDTALDAVITCDSEFIVIGWNSQAQITFGYDQETAVGQPLAELIMDDGPDALRYLGLTGDGSRNGLGQRHEILGKRQNGSVLTLEFNVNEVVAEGGILYAVFARDIDDRKRTEIELVTARDQAQAASRTKSEFLANMSHELRTPLTAILGYSEILQDPDRLALEERDDALATIHRNGVHLLGVINDILDLSKIEAGKLSLGLEPCDPRVIVADVIESLEVRAKAKGIVLTWSRTDLLPEMILTDPVRVRQVLMNLVGNAIKFTEIGNVTVSLLTRVDLDLGVALLEFEVHDTGIGMSEEQLDRLFTPFEQVDSSAGRRFGGTGLGLAISYRLAAILGGSIDVRSEAGNGSCFTFSLPAIETERRATLSPRNFGKETDDTATDESAFSEQESQTTRTIDSTRATEIELRPAAARRMGESERPLEGMRLLLVEDGPDNQRLITFVLRKFGAHVTIAGDGLDALEWFGFDPEAEESERSTIDIDGPFDLVLTDIQMPRMDGYTLASILRASGCRIPIVALTAHAMNGERDRCINAGCDAYATKPIDRAELLATIREAMACAKL